MSSRGNIWEGKCLYTDPSTPPYMSHEQKPMNGFCPVILLYLSCHYSQIFRVSFLMTTPCECYVTVYERPYSRHLGQVFGRFT